MKFTQIFFIAAVAVAGYAVYQYTYKTPSSSLPIANNETSEIPVAIERTCALIKPDAVLAGHAEQIIEMITANGLTVKQISEKQLSKEEAENFYAIHKEKPFFDDLVTFMTSGPIVALELEGEDAIKKWRTLMGSTNPENAAEGTIRKLFGTSVTQNAVHGSDSIENAEIECSQIFSANIQN